MFILVTNYSLAAVKGTVEKEPIKERIPHVFFAKFSPFLKKIQPVPNSGIMTKVHSGWQYGIAQVLSVLFFILFGGMAGFAQGKVLVSEPISLRNDYGYELIGRLRDRILLFRDKFDEFEVQAFDNQMRMSWNRKLDDLDKNGIQVLTVIGGKNDFSVIYKVRRRGVTVVRVNKYDPGANLIDTMTVKNYGERVFSPPVIEILHSEDKNCLVAINTAERSQLEATCFRLDKMQPLWDKSVHFEDNYFESTVKGMTLGDAGDYYLVTELNNRRNKLDEHELKILHIQASGDNLIRVPLPEFLTNDVEFAYDNLNHRLVGAGLYADKNRERANGIFFVQMASGGTNPVLRSEAFSDKVISILRRKDVEDDTKGIADAEVGQIILRRDGGVLMVAERHHEIQRGTAAGRGFWRDGMRIVMDFYFDDLLLVALHPDGQLHWTTVLHKKQYSQDDEATFSSYFLHATPDRLHFMFNDEIKYENTCSDYVVTPLGDFDRNSLMNTFGQNLRLRFRDAIQLSIGECLVPSEFRNKLRLVLLRF